ncbi:MAG: aminotransferase class III-fold pyridoxal phosphate-dependent enzyme [Acidimicrobiaceae bacterium]|nr:aminotransferase class III-fold pyridoxal phosphate-dependent enzyme [Acidimicrobiaceae bacterium]
MLLWQRAQRSIPGGVNSNVRLYGDPCPLTFTRAEGSHIWDVDGNEYLDFVMGMGPHILGHTPIDIEFAFEKAEEAIATL